MSVIVTKTYSTTCYGDLLDAVNANATITTVCEQILYSGGVTTDFYFATALSAPEDTELDNLLISFVCPVYPEVVDEEIIDDGATSTTSLWSSTQITNAITAVALDDLSDAIITTPVNNQVLIYNGTDWVNGTSPAGVTDHTLLSSIGTNTHAQIDTHISDTSLHFTQASISITESQISDLGTYSTTAHTHTINELTNVSTGMVPADGQVLTFDTTNGWQAETPIDNNTTDHTLLTNIGTNSHATIDTHIADATIHFTQASISITESQISDLGTYSTTAHTHTINELSNVLTGMSPTDGQVLTFDTVNGWQAETPAGGGGADVLVKVSANDTTAGYLNGKLTAGLGVLLTETNDGANETLEVAIDNSAIGVGSPNTGDILVWDGTQWVVAPNQATINDVNGTIGDLSGTAIIPISDLTPVIAQGAPLWSATVTPSKVTNQMQITASMAYGVSKTAALFVVTLFRDNVCIGSMVDKASATTSYQTVSFTIHDIPATLANVTYSCRVGTSTSATWWVNTTNDNPPENLGGTLGQNSYLILEKE